MNELTLHPNIYHTGHSKGLIHLLERLWVRSRSLGKGTLYIVSGFANYNGGVRFYDTFRSHIDKGGKVVAIFGGSTSQRLTSRQVVKELLEAGAEVHIVNRKRIMHAKSYGISTTEGQMLVVTSGNFTGPGMSQNVEMALLLDEPTTKALAFSWDQMIANMLGQKWDYYRPNLDDSNAPVWQLLYDEEAAGIKLDETDEVTMAPYDSQSPRL
jgi:phosphatidylserine/phosphatidylglycerophosphate/cardiolipin synthase-like enzyme